MQYVCIIKIALKWLNPYVKMWLSSFDFTWILHNELCWKNMAFFFLLWIGSAKCFLTQPTLSHLHHDTPVPSHVKNQSYCHMLLQCCHCFCTFGSCSYFSFSDICHVIFYAAYAESRGACPSWHWAKGRQHPELVSSRAHIETNSHAHLYCHRAGTDPTLSAHKSGTVLHD